MRRIALRMMLVVVLALTGGAVGAAPATADSDESGHKPLPKVIGLPNGFQPEGIAIGKGSSFYVGSLFNGAIYRGSVLTGKGAVFVPGVDGRAAAGLEVDRRNRLFVAGASTGAGRVYDAKSGAELRSYQFAAAKTSFINDVVVTRDAAYFTDSLNPVLYVVPIGHDGQLSNTFDTLSLSGDLEYAAGFNLNGIEASPDGRTLLVVQTNKGLLFAVNAATGVTRQVDLNGVSLANGDGLLLRGSTLYVVQNQLNQIAVIKLRPPYETGRLIRTITDKNFQVPTTIGAFGRYLYAVNARFDTPPTPDTTYTVVRVSAR